MELGTQRVQPLVTLDPVAKAALAAAEAARKNADAMLTPKARERLAEAERAALGEH